MGVRNRARCVRAVAYGPYVMAAYGSISVRVWSPYGPYARTRSVFRTCPSSTSPVRANQYPIMLGRTPYEAVRAYGAVRTVRPYTDHTAYLPTVRRTAYGRCRTRSRRTGVRAYGRTVGRDLGVVWPVAYGRTGSHSFGQMAYGPYAVGVRSGCRTGRTQSYGIVRGCRVRPVVYVRGSVRRTGHMQP